MNDRDVALDLTAKIIERISPPNQEFDIKEVGNIVAEAFDRNYQRLLPDDALEQPQLTAPEKAKVASRLAIAGVKFMATSHTRL